MGPLGVRYREEDGVWEILVYPKSVEFVGGAADGAVVCPGFSVDVRDVQNLFERVDEVSWKTQGFHGTEAPFLSVEGLYAGKKVRLQIAADAPDDDEPRLKLNVNRPMSPDSDEDLEGEKE